MPLTELVYCVTVAFRMTERADHLHHDNAPIQSTAIMQVISAKHHIILACQPPTAQIWLPATSDFSQN